MHLSSNGNKTIKDRMPAPAGRSFFFIPGTHRRSAKSQGSREPTKTQSPSGQINFQRKWNHHIPEIKWTPSANPFNPFSRSTFSPGEGGLCSLLHFMEVLCACVASVLPHLTSILFPSFCLFWETIFFVCDMFFLVLISLSFFIFFYYFLFATVTLVKKIKDAAQEFL